MHHSLVSGWSAVLHWKVGFAFGVVSVYKRSPDKHSIQHTLVYCSSAEVEHSSCCVEGVVFNLTGALIDQQSCTSIMRTSI